MKHTKGPWNIDGGTNEKGDLFVWKEGVFYGGHAIATVHGEIQEGSEANAALIAAAPDLLEACKEAESVADHEGVATTEYLAIWSKVRAAIAKATD